MAARLPDEVQHILKSLYYQRIELVERELIGAADDADAAFSGMLHFLAVVYLTCRAGPRSPVRVRQALIWALDVIKKGIDDNPWPVGSLTQVNINGVLRDVAKKAIEEIGTP